MWRAPRFFVLARVGFSSTWKPACRSRLVNAGSGAEDQTERIPPGLERPMRGGQPPGGVERIIAFTRQAIGTIVDIEQYGVPLASPARINSPTSPWCRVTRGSSRHPAKTDAIGPCAQAMTSGTSSATVMEAPSQVPLSAGAQGEPHAEPADQHARRRLPFKLFRRQIGQRLFRSAQPAVHQLVGAEHDRIFLPRRISLSSTPSSSVTASSRSQGIMMAGLS
jgi:hypothetical protein